MIQVKESYFWTQVKAGLENAETHLSRIENTAGTGISDISACSHGVEVWLELKVFHGDRLQFRTSQRTWIMRRTDVGGKVLIVARKGDELYVYDGRKVVMANVAWRDDKSFSIATWDLPAVIFHCKKPFKWDEIRKAVFDQW